MLNILQNIVFTESVKTDNEFFFRSSGQVTESDNSITLAPGAEVSTKTYMNVFDTGIWHRCTGSSLWKLKLDAAGKGVIRLMYYNGITEELKEERSIDTMSEQEEVFVFDSSDKSGFFYITASAEDTLTVSNAAFCTDEDADITEIGIIICTYRRQDEVKKLISVIKETLFYSPDNPLCGKIKVFVVDNASETDRTLEDEFTKIIYNENSGGSGGFTRGIHEIRRTESLHNITHVLFMDDDVELMPETLYRLYALLSHAKGEYKNRSVAGRMFRTDLKNIQYTACEVWNRGDLKHVGCDLDMTDEASLEGVNDTSEGEYGGWWFCCFPYSFVKDNDPMPFFLHCDDVEYGLRHGKKPLILNGIQVWHETADYRQSPSIIYYDARNPIIVNVIHDTGADKEMIFQSWAGNTGASILEGKPLFAYMQILALNDFLKGYEWMKNNTVRRNTQIRRIKSVSNMKLRIMRKLVFAKYRSKFEKAAESYKQADILKV